MVKFILKRLVQMVFILFIASILIFAMIRISPSDPIASMTKGKKISDETRQSLTEEYYLVLCGQIFENSSHALTPSQDSTGCGAFHLSSPTGGAAYGTPL